MRIFDVKLSLEYEDSLIGIIEYLNGFSPLIGAKYYEMIQEKVFSLAIMPLRCPLVRDDRLAEKGVRKISAKNYDIFFIVDENSGIVYVERILYSSMAFDILL